MEPVAVCRTSNQHPDRSCATKWKSWSTMAPSWRDRCLFDCVTARCLQDTPSAVTPQNGPLYSDERCRSQSLSQVNHSIDPVPGHHMRLPNCLTKHARSFRAFKTSHRRGSLTSKLPYANFAKLTAFWIVAQFPLVTKLAKRRKPYYCFRIQPKEQAHHRKSSMHKYRHALTMSIIFHAMKIICRSTRI